MILQQSTADIDYCAMISSYSFMVLLSTCLFSALWSFN